MNSLLVLVLWAAGFCIAFSIANFYWPHLPYDAEGKANGCQHAACMPNKYPFPFNIFEADKEKKKVSPGHGQQMFRHYSSILVDTTTELLFGELLSSQAIYHRISESSTLANDRFMDKGTVVLAFNYEEAWLSDQSGFMNKY
ncbi:cytochrome P450 monooxygenase 52A6 [Fusarium denticulatum]|uniref:Cytochrome P450 monooxygenase 52A6 n=1 Tax=Fusarium denticulatum TaxID=48507 RepID=A0A8H5XJ67_9HYPO|nr:cytochrome P450 monooxygenase 52A6 [Fusarium denticulatum]